MESISIGKTTINLNFEIQLSTLGRPFRYSGCSLDLTKAPIWQNKMYLHDTYYHFKYLDDDTFFKVFVSADQTIKQIIKS